MIRTDERIEYEGQVSEIEHAVQEAISTICEKYDHQITYAQINTALVNVMKSNLRYVARYEIEKIEKSKED